MDDVTLQSRLRALVPQGLGQRPEAVGSSPQGPSFSDVLKNAISEVNELQADADTLIRDLQLGKDVDIHDAMVALNKMELSFKLLMEVRSKLLKAYEEIMRTQL